MIDGLGRTIDYLRISLTDRCNLRCRYCMPDGVADAGRNEVLSYEEMLFLCRAAAACGVTKFKVTGGEPFVRRDAVRFMAALRRMGGVSSLTVTTNGVLLQDYMADLEAAGIDGVNISLDSLDREQYRAITGKDALPAVLGAVKAAAASSVTTKVNAVLLGDTKDQVPALADLAASLPVDVRFIEVMPVGCGRYEPSYSADEALAVLRGLYPDLTADRERRGNGPAVYFKSRRLIGRIGIIAANSHAFCRTCNRMRLTSTGFLKPCLYSPHGVDLKRLVRRGAGLDELAGAFCQAALAKPEGHGFAGAGTETKTMNEIGG